MIALTAARRRGLRSSGQTSRGGIPPFTPSQQLALARCHLEVLRSRLRVRTKCNAVATPGQRIALRALIDVADAEVERLLQEICE